MKNLIVLVFILITKITFAQQKDTVGLNTPFINGDVIYQKVFLVTRSYGLLSVSKI
jgi:hypothetical protein